MTDQSVACSFSSTHSRHMTLICGGFLFGRWRLSPYASLFASPLLPSPTAASGPRSTWALYHLGLLSLSWVQIAIEVLEISGKIERSKAGISTMFENIFTKRPVGEENYLSYLLLHRIIDHIIQAQVARHSFGSTHEA
ncbi:hypothetical protein P152DRAFT_453489 [Eremomyces bilateralis CBS 781.70]|uniref:Uncharacterized protein n=1 Tax=Eremomyces bilateralis CBS 781.70 TaxID=1392243 RepID=A0A6G1GG45_9PEZI|nr:uncharacterized protein P152DRAFT_453489 [Eremomyces bilateralis CBS 781.70]KAF1816881.1 hypothetical protein P152DRAFT_453489 [Eremomyces bilateralis CBS 781.70]